MNRIIKDIVDGSQLSIIEISGRSDIPVNRIIDIIENRSSITVSEAFDICDVVGVNLDNILKCY